METKADFIAELKYLSTKDGGRKTAAKNGYRPHIKFEFSDFLTSGYQKFIDKEEIFPGETVSAEITITSTIYFERKLEIGMNFTISEGMDLVGSGQIIRILNENLKKAKS